MSGVLAERLHAQRLSGAPHRDPVAVAEHLLAIQAQDLRGARLAVRARSEAVTAADVDAALTEHRSLIVTWLGRGTLHLIRTEDYPLLQLVTTPPLFTGNARRLAQEGVSADAAERGVRLIVDALADAGPLTRAQLADRLEHAGVPVAGQAIVHLLLLASLRGHIVRGPLIGAQHAFVLVRDWLGECAPPDRDTALAELARRYLVGHAPADDRDLAKWSGLPLRDVRAGLRAIARECTEREDGLLELTRRRARRVPALPAPRLLGPWDPVLLGWRSREFLTGSHKVVITVNGLFRPFALVDGGAVATWKLAGDAVRIEPLQDISARDLAALEADGDAVLSFLSS